MSDLEPVVVASAARTPIGRFMGGLAPLPATRLGGVAAARALEKAGIEPEVVDSGFFGMARQAGARPNPARQVMWEAGVPQEKTAMTINQACASGLQSILLAADAIRAGRSSVALAGGMESMSNVPYMLGRMRGGFRLGDGKIEDLMHRDGFSCPLSEMLMGETAELLATEDGISREEQDAFALQSQQKAGAAWADGRFSDEVVPIEVPSRKGSTVVERDEHPRPETSPEKLGSLPPVFDVEKGTVSAGNSSGITDGAAALVLMSREAAEKYGVTPLALFEDGQVEGTDPARMGLGPVPAVNALLERRGWALDDFGLVELNEAFAAQAIACLKRLSVPEDILNVNGGAISLGHPIGCSGARIVVTLLHEMNRRRVSRGLATLCVSGGLGIAAAFSLP